jgi:GNAT superfamily N-acetyltransferase
MTELHLCEIPATDREMLEKIGRLRVRAWETFGGKVEGLVCWLDPFDEVARHWVVLSGEEPVAAARLSVHHTMAEVPDSEVFTPIFREPPPSPIASLNRLVVSPAYRGKGMSTWLDEVRLEAAEAMGCTCAVGATASGDRRVQQLIKVGFMVLGRGNRSSYPILAHLGPQLVLVCPLPRSRMSSGPNLS